MFKKLPMYQRQGATAYKKDLDNIKALCSYLGNPQNQFKSIHIGGTNGKGSVTHLIAAALISSGYKVGIYTSPHYKDFRERIKIGKELISKKDVIQFIEDHREKIEEIRPSFFEITVAMAFKYFADAKVDYAVIEVGLGGRLDSTNIIKPILSVITNIGMDHSNMLGDTLEKIAFEKAGIIKAKTPVVIGERGTESDKVFIQKAKEQKAPIHFSQDIYKTEILQEGKYYKCKVYGPKTYDFYTSMTGDFQEKNLATCFQALEILSHSLRIELERFLEILIDFSAYVHYIGRWQTLQDKPLIIADSAHNADGMTVIVDMIKKKKASKVHCVLGFANDKDLKGLLSLLPTFWKYYFCKANIPRGLNADELKQTAEKYGLLGKNYKSVRHALAAAKKSVREDEMIFVGGSIFVVAEAI